MSRTAQKARMDAYVVAEIQAYPFRYALEQVRRADRELAEETKRFLKASAAIRADIASIIGSKHDD